MRKDDIHINMIGRDSISAPANRASKAISGLQKSANALHRPLGKISTASNEITKSLEASNARVIAFGASALVINSVKNAFVGTLKAAKDLELALTKIQSINKATNSQMKELSKTITQISRDTGQTFGVAAEAATEFSRQGLSATETAKRLKAAMIQVRIEGVSATEAVSGLTAILNGFSSSGLDAIQVLNKLNAVADSFAVSSKDIVEGFKRGGSVAEQAKVSFDEYSAAIAVVQEKTARGGAVIGNAFKTIFTRIQNKGTITALKGIGVEVENMDGSLRNAVDVLKDVAKQTDKLSELKRQNIFEKIAGKRQIALLIPLMQELNKEFSKFDRAVSISAGATNEALMKNEAYNNTIDGTIKRISSLGTELAQVSGEQLFGELNNGMVSLNGVASALEGIISSLASEDFSVLRAAVKSIGSFLSGPGLAIGATALVVAFSKLAKFSAEGAISMIGLQTSTQKTKLIQEQMQGILAKNYSIEELSEASSKEKAVIEAQILAIYQKQASALASMQSMSMGAASSRGVKPMPVGRAAGGHNAVEAMEKIDVLRGVGGAPRSAKPITVKGFNFGSGKIGNMVANSSEYLVKSPRGDSILTKDMYNDLGRPSSATPVRAASGFISGADEFGGRRGLKKSLKLNNSNMSRLESLSAGASSGANAKTLGREAQALTAAVRKSRGSVSALNEVFRAMQKTSATFSAHSGEAGAKRLKLSESHHRKYLKSLDLLSKSGVENSKSFELFRSKIAKAGGDVDMFDRSIVSAQREYDKKRGGAKAIGKTREYTPYGDMPRADVSGGGNLSDRRLASGVNRRARFSGIGSHLKARGGRYGLGLGVAASVGGSFLAENEAKGRSRADRSRSSRFKEAAFRDVGTYATTGATLGGFAAGPAGAAIGGIGGAALGLASAFQKAALTTGEVISMMTDALNKEKMITKSLHETLSGIEAAMSTDPENWMAAALKGIQDNPNAEVRDALHENLRDAASREDFESSSKKTLKDQEIKELTKSTFSTLVAKNAAGDFVGTGERSREDILDPAKNLTGEALKNYTTALESAIKAFDLLAGGSERYSAGEAERIMSGMGFSEKEFKAAMESFESGDVDSGRDRIRVGERLREVGVHAKDEANDTQARAEFNALEVKIEALNNILKSPHVSSLEAGGSAGVDDFTTSLVKLRSDMEEALSLKGKSGIKARKDINQSFDMNEYIKRAMKLMTTRGLSVEFSNQLTKALTDGIKRINRKKIANEMADLRSGLSSNINNSYFDAQDMLGKALGVGSNVEGRFGQKEKDLERSIASRGSLEDQQALKGLLQLLQSSDTALSVAGGKDNSIKKQLESAFGGNIKNIKSADEVSTAMNILTNALVEGKIKDSNLINSIEALNQTTQKTNLTNIELAKFGRADLAIKKKFAEFNSAKASRDLSNKASVQSLSKQNALDGIQRSEAASIFALRQRARLDTPGEFSSLSIGGKASKEAGIKRSIVDAETSAQIANLKANFKLSQKRLKIEQDNIEALRLLTEEVRKLTDAYNGKTSEIPKFLKKERLFPSVGGGANAKSGGGLSGSASDSSFSFMHDNFGTSGASGSIVSSGGFLPSKNALGAGSGGLSIQGLQNSLLQDKLDIDIAKAQSQNRISHEGINIEEDKGKRQIEDMIEARKGSALRGLESAVGDPMSTKSQIASARNLNRQVLANDPYGNAADGFRESFAAIQDETASFQKSFAKDIPLLFRDNMASAFASIAQDFSSLEDVAIGFIQNIADAMTQKFSTQLANQIMGSGAVGGSDGTGGIIGMVSGLFTRRKNSGGLISGGTGTKDDVPVMTRGGEYVMKKSAVQKYGVGFFDQMNNGTGFSSGGLNDTFNTLGGLGVGAGLSSIAGSLQNRKNNKIIAAERAELMKNAGSRQGGSDFFIPGVTTPNGQRQGYLQGSDLSSFLNQRTTSGSQDRVSSSANGFKFNLEDQSSKLSLRSLFGGVEGASNISSEIMTAKGEAAGLMMDDARMRADLKKAKDEKKKGLLMSLLGAGITGGLTSLFGGFGGASMVKKASGGSIAAMGGEYMLGQDTVNQYGTQFLDSLNSGAVPTKMASGGSTSSSSPVSGVSSANNELKDLTSEIRKNGLGKTEINITIDSNGDSTTTSNSTSPESIEEQKLLAQMIESKVMEVLEKQRRVGSK